MDDGTRKLMLDLVSEFSDRLPGTDFYDIGSLDVNGRNSDIVEPLGLVNKGGIDIRKGPNVDHVVPERGAWNLPAVSCALSSSTLEHVQQPWEWIRQVAAILKPGGLLFVVAPWRWPIHNYPVDCWRILPDGLRSLFKHGGFEPLRVVTCGDITGGVGVLRGPAAEFIGAHGDGRSIYDHFIAPLLFDGARVADIGCGAGRFAAMGAESRMGKWHGVDISRKEVAKCQRRLGSDVRFQFDYIDVFNGRYNRSGKKGSYKYPIRDHWADVSLSMSIVTHAETDAECRMHINELARVTAPKGRLLLSALVDPPYHVWDTMGAKRTIQKSEFLNRLILEHFQILHRWQQWKLSYHSQMLYVCERRQYDVEYQ